MAYEIEPYDEDATVFEAVNDGIPEFYGTYDQCVEYVNNNTK